MNITTHGGTTDASDKQPSVVTIGSKDLLGCPFCASKNITVEQRTVGWRHNAGTTQRLVCVCGDCGAQGPEFGIVSFVNESTAKQYWQHRRAS